jgi:hypothetical protein
VRLSHSEANVVAPCPLRRWHYCPTQLWQQRDVQRPGCRRRVHASPPCLIVALEEARLFQRVIGWAGGPAAAFGAAWRAPLT